MLKFIADRHMTGGEKILQDLENLYLTHRQAILSHLCKERDAWN